MTSASVAFGKLSKWKNDKTPLKVTFWIEGKPSRPQSCRIDNFDSATYWLTISLSEDGTKQVDLEDSAFSIEPRNVVTVSKHRSVLLTFEEISE
jgi:hypothetical protein